MTGICDVLPSDLIKKVAEELKKIDEIKAPEWSKFVKTGAHKERPPQDPDWWHIRVAAILRKVYINGPIGVSKLKSKYGGKRNRGHKPERFYKGSGKIARTALQQLEKAGFVKKVEKKAYKGRIVTAKGKLLLTNISKKL